MLLSVTFALKVLINDTQDAQTHAPHYPDLTPAHAGRAPAKGGAL